MSSGQYFSFLNGTMLIPSITFSNGIVNRLSYVHYNQKLEGKFFEILSLHLDSKKKLSVNQMKVNQMLPH